MPANGANQRFSPEFRTSVFYFTTMLSGGAQVAFLPIWLVEKGVLPSQIGLVNAVPLALIVLMNLFLGRLADRARDWRQVIVICSVICGLVSLGLFQADGFWSILVVWSGLQVPIGAMTPVLDAAAVRLTRRNGSDFGNIRAWGTVGYMLMNALTGFLVVHFGSSIFVPLFVVLGLARMVLSFWLPRFRAPDQKKVLAPVKPEPGQLRRAMQPWFILPLVGFCVVYGTHWLMSGYAALLWKQQGISEAVIGPLIAVGSFSEAAMMFAWKRFGARMSARHLMIVSAVVATFRWIVMAFAPPVPVLFFLQLLHCLTFALGYLGCVHFIANWTSEDIAAEVQSLFSMAQQLVSVFAVTMFGVLVGIFGVHSFFIAAAVSVIGGLMVAVSLKMRGVKR